MAKLIPNNALDQRLNYDATAIAMHLCAGQPSSFGDVTSLTRAVVAMAGGDYTLANGPVDGRQVTMAAKNAVPVTAIGTCDHIALVDGAALIVVTTCDSVAVTTADTVNFPGWTDRCRQAT